MPFHLTPNIDVRCSLRLVESQLLILRESAFAGVIMPHLPSAAPFAHGKHSFVRRAARPGQNSDGETGPSAGTGAEGSGPGSESREDLRGMGERSLKARTAGEGIDAHGCQDKEDMVLKIEAHRRNQRSDDATLAATMPSLSFPSADAASSSRENLTGGRVAPAESEREAESELAGMTLADYMNRPAPTVDAQTGGGTGRSRGRRGDGVPPLSAPSSGGRRPGTTSGKLLNPRTVRLAPSHIAPPSTPAPDWVVEMQVQTHGMSVEGDEGHRRKMK